MNIELWRQRKKELHLTHDQLAEKAGVSRRVVASIFGGDARGQNPTLATIAAIEKALGLNTPSLEWTDEDKAAGVTFTSPYNNLSKEEVKWFELRSLIIEKQGEEYLNTVIEMLTTLMNQKK